MHRLLDHLRSNLVGWIALFVALGGTGYAAVRIPRNSVGAAQIRNHSITPVKLNQHSIGGSVRAWAMVSSTGKVLVGSGGPRVQPDPSTPGLYSILWRVRLPGGCATLANLDSTGPTTETLPANVGGIPGTASYVAGYVSDVGSGPLRQGDGVYRSESSVNTFNQSGQPTPLGFEIAVIC